MNWLKFIVVFAITLSLHWFLSRKMGSNPALGYLLNPFEGFLQNTEIKRPDELFPKSIPGLKGKASVKFDDMMIPHIYAENEEDLYFLQGFVTAYFRLWQMDMITRAASGRLCEVVGDISLKRDRFMRRIGMVEGAKKAVTALESNPKSSSIVHAYSKGVNAWIQMLGYQNFSIEFKLLGYKPEPWSSLKTALLLKYMAWDLSGNSSDKELSEIRNYLGEDVVKELFTDYPELMEPIHPRNEDWKKFPKPQVKTPKTDWAGSIESSYSMTYAIGKNLRDVGSNNFVVNGKKSKTGFPVLANDPHLRLGFPSIWFQIQLHGPNSNAAGASLPGAPCVISGFNQNIAWGVTNVAPDVLDYYKIKFKDNSRKEYFHDNQWKKITYRIDTFEVRGKGIVLDTVEFTHHGPIVDPKGENFHPECPKDHALRWLAHDQSNELLTFYQLNFAKNYQEYREALKHYSCPAQNFIFASKENDIALCSNGKYPLKWKNQGKFTLDGSDPLHDWQGFIPNEHNPLTLNPKSNFIASANQFPTDTTYPYFLHWEFAPFERGKRIHDRLKTMENVTMDSLRILQLDTKNMFAELILPFMIDNLDAAKIENPELLDKMKKWNFHHEPEIIEPTIFTAWWDFLENEIWDEFFIANGKDTLKLRLPDKERTAWLMKKNPKSQWFDKAKTQEKETIKENLQNSWNSMIEHLTRKMGSPEKWLWYLYRGTKVQHLARLAPFSSDYLKHGGGSHIVNALGPTAGPSWRMVIELGETPKAWGIYPAGQSGNPGSVYYDNMLPIWLKGELKEILFFTQKDQTDPRILSSYQY